MLAERQTLKTSIKLLFVLFVYCACIRVRVSVCQLKANRAVISANNEDTSAYTSLLIRTCGLVRILADRSNPRLASVSSVKIFFLIIRLIIH